MCNEQRINIVQSPIPYLIIFLFLCDIGLLALYYLNIAIGAPVNFITKITNVNEESSIATWFSVGQFLLTGIFAAVHALCHTRKRQILKSLAMWAVALLFIAMSMDESIQVHEWLGAQTDKVVLSSGRESSSFKSTGVWMFTVGIPGVLAILAVMWFGRSYFLESPKRIVLFVIGLILLVTGGLVFESISNFLESGKYIAPLEEFFEMVGSTFMLWSIFDMLPEHVMLYREVGKPS
jgi:hypothetical protein